MPKISGKQYGFTKGRSTSRAIEDLLQWADNSEESYCMGVFLDISGAFDNLKWPTLLGDMRRLGCSKTTRAITVSYLTGRTATLTQGGVTETVILTKGCPQGSVFGPILWCITMEDLLLTALPAYSGVQAYADDIAVLVTGSSRVNIKVRAEAILTVVKN